MRLALENREAPLSDPARFAQAIRGLAYDAHRTLRHSPSPAALRKLSRRIDALVGGPRRPPRGARSGPGWTTSGERCGRRPSTGPGHLAPCASVPELAARVVPAHGPGERRRGVGITEVERGWPRRYG